MKRIPALAVVTDRQSFFGFRIVACVRCLLEA